MHGGGETVIGGLAAIDMVIGMDGAFAAALSGQQFVGIARDHLIDVHVRLGAGAGLPDDERKLVVQLA
jgi:hypothetical protein